MSDEKKMWRVTFTVQEVRSCIVDAKDEKEAYELCRYGQGRNEVLVKEESLEPWLAEEVK